MDKLCSHDILQTNKDRGRLIALHDPNATHVSLFCGVWLQYGSAPFGTRAPLVDPSPPLQPNSSLFGPENAAKFIAFWATRFLPMNALGCSINVSIHQGTLTAHYFRLTHT